MNWIPPDQPMLNEVEQKRLDDWIQLKAPGYNRHSCEFTCTATRTGIGTAFVVSFSGDDTSIDITDYDTW